MHIIIMDQTPWKFVCKAYKGISTTIAPIGDIFLDLSEVHNGYGDPNVLILLLSICEAVYRIEDEDDSNVSVGGGLRAYLKSFSFEVN